MNRITKLLTLLTILAVSNAQFFYNYEQDSAHDIPGTDEFDLSQYKYNSPSMVGQQFVQQVPRVAVQVAPRSVETRRRSRQQVTPTELFDQQQQDFKRQRMQPQPVVNVEYAEDLNNNEQFTTEPAEVTKTSRRTSKRRQRINHRVEEEIIVDEAPKYYGPSVFENIRLGQAPSGVYVPDDSLLNVLNRDTPRIRQRNPINRPTIIAEQPNEVFVTQPSTSTTPVQRTSSIFFAEPPSFQSYQFNTEPSEYQRNYNRYRLFVQPPSNLQPAIPPVQQPRVQYIQVQEPPNTVQQESPNELSLDNEDIEEYEYGHRARTTEERRVQPTAAPVAPRRSNRKRQRTSTRGLQPALQPHVTYDEASVSITVPERQDTSRQFQPATDDLYRTSRRTHHQQQQSRRGQKTQIQSVTDAPSGRRKTTTFKPANLAIAELPNDLDDDGIPGTASVDYPTLHVIPKTSFACTRQAHNGYYADLETSCQVVHLCQFGGAQDSFLCPNGTIFSQEKLSCQWWYEVDCQNSPRFYSINDSLYKVKENE